MRSLIGERPLTSTGIGQWAGGWVGTLLLGLVALGLAVSIWLRLAPIFAAFPFGDGGLFWVMANDLRENGFVPPDVTTYNTGDIPWVYPPLGIYLVALLGGDVAILRFLPAAWAIATLPAFWLLARALIGERGALVALLAYGLTAPAFTGLIAGGGVTRGPGLLLALLTMWATVRGSVAGAGAFAGLTLLSHPIAAFYALLASATLWLTRGAQPRMLLAVGIAFAIGAAWFGPMVALHGVDPLVAGLGSRDLDLWDNVVTLVASAINPPNLAFTVGLVGLAIAARRRRWDLIAWLAVSVFGLAVVDRWMVIPLAVLAGLAVDAALSNPARRPSVALLAIAALVMVTGVVLARPSETLSVQERATIDWATRETPADSTFAVIGYPVDRGFVEWFPALSQRVNLTTWQGSEWLRGEVLRRDATVIASCRTAECLPDADYFVLRPGCCPEAERLLVRVGPDAFRRR